MKKLLLQTSIPKIYMIVMLAISVLMIGSYFSYAMFTVSKEKSNAISIITGSLTGLLKVDGVEGNTLEVAANTSKTFTVELSNTTGIKAKFNFYYTGTLSSTTAVGYLDVDGYNLPPEATGIVLEASGSTGSSQVYRIIVKNTGTTSVTIPIGYSVSLEGSTLLLPDDGNLFPLESIEPSEPVLASNMIPVVYDGTNWVKADENSDWYDYDNQMWANAVTVSETSRSTYLTAAIGTAISMDDINTMFVWIPRYSYTIKSEDGTNYYGKQGRYLDQAPTQALPGEIDIEFIDKSVKDTGTAQYTGTAISGYRTPDAFTFGDEELSGIWVGKFETSNLEGQYTTNSSSLTPIVKPNTTIWYNAQLSNYETAALAMVNEGNVYGFSSSEVDSHVALNTEWAAVAYLSQSRYGKLGNTEYSGANKEIYINKAVVTGCSYGEPSHLLPLPVSKCEAEYDNIINQGDGKGSAGAGASTTGNIYGIYDMNGGLSEIVMGNYNNYAGCTTLRVNSSGYEGLYGENGTGTLAGIPFPANKYYNLYTTHDPLTACSGESCLSHALSEVSGWYGDCSYFIPIFSNGDEVWISRGGHYFSASIDTGIFSFNREQGSGGSVSIRLVLATH